MHLVFPCIDGSLYEQQEEPRVIHRRDVVERHRLKNASELIVPLHGPRGRLWFRYAGYVWHDGHHFGEMALFNASMAEQDAIGYLRGYLYDKDSERTILPKQHLFDQCAMYATIGQPRYAPDLEGLERFMQGMDLSKLTPQMIEGVKRATTSSGVLGGFWTNPYEPGGEDNDADTNSSSSPNASLLSRLLIAFGVAPNDHGALVPIFQWLGIQLGTRFTERSGYTIDRPGRSGCLFDFETGDFARPYTQSMQEHLFDYGTIGRRLPNFGRHQLEIAEVEDLGFSNHHAWIGKRLIWPGSFRIPDDGYVRFGNRINGFGWNMTDPEHDFRDPHIDALCLLTPSMFARDWRTLMVETAVGKMNGKEVPQDFDYNSRSWWRVRSFLNAAVTFNHNERLWAMVRRCRDHALAENYIAQPWAKEWLFYNGSRNHRGPERTYLEEEPWKLSTAIEVCNRALECEPQQSEKPEWDRLRQKLVKICRKCVIRDPQTGAMRGMAKRLAITDRGAAPIIDGDHQIGWLGVWMWPFAVCPEEPWAQEGFAHVRRHAPYHEPNRGDEQAFKWFWRHFMRT